MLLIKISPIAAIIPYKSTWIPPIFPTFLWSAGYILQRLNNIIVKITKGRVGFELTYFDFDDALRRGKWNELLVKTLLNKNSLIYVLDILRYDTVKNFVVEHMYGKRNHGEKLAYIMSLELILREIYKYID
jgi:hypothetical protein